MFRFVVLAATVAVAQAAAGVNTDCTKYSHAPKCPACFDKTVADAACSSAANTVDTLAQVDVALGCGLYFQCVDEKSAAQKAAADNADAAKANALYTQYKCPTDKSKCVDSSADALWCPQWAKDKQCLANAEWMLVNCQKSCCPVCTAPAVVPDNSICPVSGQESSCRVDSKVAGVTCAAWATKGQDGKSQCDVNPKWMVPNCMQSCCPTCQFSTVDLCPTVAAVCATKHSSADECSAWAKSGQCTTNPKWMNVNCAKDCCPICKPVAPAKSVAPIAVSPIAVSPFTAVAPISSNTTRQYIGAAIVGQGNFQLPQQAGVIQQPRVAPATVVQQPAFGGYAPRQGAQAVPAQAGFSYLGR